MEARALRSAVRRLRHVAAAPAAPAGPDAELLRAFAGRRDAAAFEQLVRRHGPMVLGLCRRLLRDAADADDAFQATFLVLMRKAGSLRAPDRLAGWLFQVAYRTARKARALRRARARREGALFDVPAVEPPAHVVWRELRPIFDAELNRLPDGLRQAAVLCLLEGHSKADAARSLGWPEGTLSCRLQRARERLRARLAARGLTLSAGALAAALFDGAGAAAVPDRLIESTLRGIWTPAAAAGARALADGVTQAMFLTKMKTVAAAVLVAGVVGTGTGLALEPRSGTGRVMGDEPTKDAPAKAATATIPGDPKSLDKEIDVARLNLQLAQLDADDKAANVAAARRDLRQALMKRLDALRSKADRLGPLLAKGTYPRTDWDALQADIRSTEAALTKLAPPGGPADVDRAIQRQELALLKERLEWEKQMVRKGFLAESEVDKTRLEVVRADAALARAEVPKAADPRRVAADDVIRKLEQIVEQTRESVRRGITPLQDLLNSEATLERYRFELLASKDRPVSSSAPMTAEQRKAMESIIKKLEEIVAQTAEAVRKKNVPVQELHNAEIKLLEYKFKLAERSGPPVATPPAAEQRAAMEAVVKKLEEIVAQTEEGVRRKIIPEQELLTSQLQLLEYKFKLAELSELPAPPAPAARTPVERADAAIAAAEHDLARAEAAHEQKIIPAAEVRELRVKLNRLRGQAATARGDYAEAARQLDAVVAEMEARAADVRAGVERRANPPSELRMVEVGLAEARVDALRARVRLQLALIVSTREADLKEVRALADAKAISREELRRAERALADAKARLSAER